MSTLLGHLFAVPTGAPQDFQRGAASNNGQWMFTWQPPAAQSQNGAITGYNFSCYPAPRAGVLQNGYSIVTTTYISVDNFTLEENYTCSVAARTAQGEGPTTSLQFNLADAAGVPLTEDCPQDLQIPLYALGGVSIILLPLCIFLCFTLVVYCLSKRIGGKRR